MTAWRMGQIDSEAAIRDLERAFCSNPAATTTRPFSKHTKSAQLRPKFSRKAEAAEHETGIGVGSGKQ